MLGVMTQQKQKSEVEPTLTPAQMELARRFRIAPDAPVLPNMTSWCKVDFVVNEKGDAMVVFDQPMPELVDWVEFDADVHMVTFVTYTGKIFSLGAPLSRPFRDGLRKGLDVQLIQVEPDGKGTGGMMPVMVDRVPLVIREIGI
jgi:hypothetical protein